jgi:hypothetical protein
VTTFVADRQTAMFTKKEVLQNITTIENTKLHVSDCSGITILIFRSKILHHMKLWVAVGMKLAKSPCWSN